MKSNLQLYHTCKDKATSEACVYSVWSVSSGLFLGAFFPEVSS